MGSLLPGYEHDIFVSYRHHDNKYDGWVTEFVERLQQELNATLKDRLTIYFDKNPESGLSDNHVVDQSIGNKIKSLIFIPVISQTYCDTSSFAWKQEFKVFKDFADNDRFKRTIRLSNGNFTSRILPVKIHDIDVTDLRLLETELAGTLRSIDFIYRDAGVNRPLRPVDDDIQAGTAQARILYRNQINKLAYAIKEIVQGIKDIDRHLPQAVNPSTLSSPEPSKGAFSSSHPSASKVKVLDQSGPSVYLAWTSSDLKEEREEMAITLKKAGFNVLPSTDCPADDESFKEKVREDMARCSCSLHMLGGEFGRRFEFESEVSFPQFQFLEARKMIESGETDFNCFIWMLPEASAGIKPDQRNFINFIRNNITQNMMFSNSMGPMQLVDDMRVVMKKEEEELFDSKDTEIFFIYNQQDEAEAKIITDHLSTEYPVEIMNILPDGEDKYREISTQQIPKSKLAVVYFKYAADWALPFTKQVWKTVGGASSPTPLFLVGEDDPSSNRARNFKAPKVVSSIVPKEEVPAEVKKVYITVKDMS
ncbi:DUF4062 domain-containing protein [Rhodohalobacter mucosus]|uniref:DUF4062 domain-containing protein n=1 Tax=Rhodohalobacter mucosus TaxID=2079485 RepID=A0A316TSA0_9BACT|nr:DUF4062 domain-containing protein [Rhodohalobacter mucosus]PWN05104.1 hypothetical protein DDZ15_16245 [Rhodohalobacter mucosus]